MVPGIFAAREYPELITRFRRLTAEPRYQYRRRVRIAQELYRQALSLWGPDPLSGFFVDFAILARIAV